MTGAVRRLGRRALVLVGGVLLVLLGTALLVLPGPGWVTIFAGLALLATEFAWAGRLLAWARRRAGDGWARLRRSTPTG